MNSIPIFFRKPGGKKKSAESIARTKGELFVFTWPNYCKSVVRMSTGHKAY